MESPNPSPRSLPAVVQSQLPALPATTSARPESPFPGPGSQYSPNSQAVSVHSSPDAILNGTLIASATRLRRVKEDILSTPFSAERFYGSPNCPKQCDTYVALCGYVSESFCCYPFSKHLLFDFRLPASIRWKTFALRIRETFNQHIDRDAQDGNIAIDNRKKVTYHRP